MAEAQHPHATEMENRLRRANLKKLEEETHASIQRQRQARALKRRWQLDANKPVRERALQAE